GMSPSQSPSGAMPRRVAMLAFPEVELLDVVGPLEVFASANAIRAGEAPGAPPLYRTVILAPEAGLLGAASGLRIAADAAFRDLSGPLDTLLVAGGAGVHAAVAD